MAINLLPWREQRAARQVRRYGLFLAAGIIIISLLTVSLVYFLNFLKIDYQSRNRHLAQAVSSIQLTGDMQKLSAQYQLAAQQIKLIQTIHLNQRNFWQELAFLQNKLPADMPLTHLTWINDELRLQGATAHSEQIGLLIKSLETSHFFSQVFLDSIDKPDNDPLIHFTIRANRIQEPAT